MSAAAGAFANNDRDSFSDENLRDGADLALGGRGAAVEPSSPLPVALDQDNRIAHHDRVFADVRLLETVFGQAWDDLQHSPMAVS